MVDSGAQRKTYGQWWDSTEEKVTVPLEAVRRVGLATFEAAGATPEDAAFLLDIRLDKALQGDVVRGFRRLPALLQSARNGEIDFHPTIQVIQERGATALVDGGPKAAPALVCRFAMDLAVQKAERHGIGSVGARAHAEILTPLVGHAVARDMVGIVMTQSFPSVSPVGGMGPLLGNAPVAFGIPAGRHDPVILDLSITQSSATPVFYAASQDEQVPPDLILDQVGEPTTDARDFLKPGSESVGFVPRGSLLPLGGARSGHKGYALVFVVGLLSYLLTDTSPPWELARDLPDPGRYGTLLMAIDPSITLTTDEFKGRVDQFIDRVKATPRKPGVSEILYPGERSQQLQRDGKASGGVSMPASHYHGLVGLSKELGMEGVL